MTAKPNVLLVDDSRSVLIVGQHVLERAGYQTLLATDGREALDILLTSPSLVVFIDDLMPRMTCFDVFRGLEGTGMMWDHEFIIWTANYDLKDDPELVRLQQLYTIAILEKPFKADALLAHAESATKRLHEHHGTRPG